MRLARHSALKLFVLCSFIVGCAAPSSPTGAPHSDRSGVGQTAAPKRVVAAIMGAPANLQSKATGPGRAPGYDALEALVSVGLTAPDDRGALRGLLAEAAPSLDNGLWKLMPDGRMETTWRIRPNARWHDGQPFTSADVTFSAAVFQDREIPNFRDGAFEMIESVEAPDAQTVVVQWKRSFIEADTMFSEVRIVPQPKHLLERVFLENKAGYVDASYWRDDFVGTGPYRLREWALGNHVLVTANADYVLGKPKVDLIEVRFVSDPNTVVANMLAGDIDLSMGRGLSLEQAGELQERWRGGKVLVAYESWISIYPQMLDPNPAVILDPQFRRALVHAIDRETMVATIQRGLVPVAHAMLAVTEPDYAEIERGMVKYAYDPRRAVQLIEGLGYTRGVDGSFRDGAGQKPGVEIRFTDADVHGKSALAVADYWQQVGVPTDTLAIPSARANDRAWRFQRTGFELQRQPNALTDLDRYLSTQVPLPENNYTGVSKHRYMNAELDVLIGRYFSTIPHAERTQVVVQIMHHLSDQVVPLPLFYDGNSMLVAERLRNAGARRGNATEAWNAEAWEVK